MAETPSTMLDLGTQIPDFSLPNVMDDKSFSPKDCKGSRALLVMFICNHCPFVKHVLAEFKRLQDDYASRDVRIIAINSNDIQSYPEDGPSHMRELARREGWAFPFLLDETQTVAKAFQAACTPDFFLFDGKKELVYRGQLDDARPGNSKPVDGKDLHAALDAVLNARPVSRSQKPSIGCNIKWKPGNEPHYA
ncbi:MAG: thioredoxin family protein [Pseudomonadota bacterium]